MMQEKYVTLLYTLYSLLQQCESITISSIKKMLKLMEYNTEEVVENLKWLLEHKFINKKDDETFILTDTGRIKATQTFEEKKIGAFNQLIRRFTSSRAYLDYCEELYGYRMYLFNMMDKEQLDFLFNSIHINKQDRVLDLGCGAGSILNKLIEKYHCSGQGIDQINEQIVHTHSQSIKYVTGDIDALSHFNFTPNIILAVDSLYFSKDLDSLIRSLISTSSKCLYLYYSQYIFDDHTEDKSILNYDQTRLARALQKNAIPYRTINYSLNEQNLYQRSLELFPTYKKAFETENNQDIYERKLNESLYGKELYDKGLASRYLYIVPPTWQVASG